MVKEIALSVYLIFLFIHNVASASGDHEPVEEFSSELNKNESLENLSATVKFLEEGNFLEPSNEENLIENEEKSIFLEAAAQNSGISNDLNTDKTPILITSDFTLNDLKPKVEETAHQLPVRNNTQTDQIQTEEDVPAATKTVPDVKPISNETQSVNDTKQIPDDIPSFSEWAQQRLEEAEKNKEFVNESVKANGNAKPKPQKASNIRWKNYASPDCGAKVVAANSEAVSPSAILSPSKDEYKLNNCNNKVWFIIELCEPIQAKRVEIANFELFSSSPKEFTVLIGDRFPNREWSVVGQFEAKDERTAQSFDLQPHLFGRYVKVEVKSHHGSQHFCTITLFRVYGTSELEVLQKEELVEAGDYEDDDLLDTLESGDSEAPAKNILNSATDAVYSMIKKAAAVLGKGNYTDNGKATENSSTIINTCTCPKHEIICVDCSDALFGGTFELLSCRRSRIEQMALSPLVSRSLVSSDICSSFGIDFESADNAPRSGFIRSLFSIETLCAMCNHLLVVRNMSVLNVSLDAPRSDNVSNQPLELTDLFPVEVSDIVHDEIKLNVNIVESPSSAKTTDSSIGSQIKPTKTTVIESLNESVEIETISEETTVEDKVEDVPVPTIAPVSVVPTISTTPLLTEPEISNDKVDEATEIVEDPLEQIMTDLNSGPSPPATTTTTPGQESVFLRLSNRIKTLERNMSLSSQYLEELSKRYKRQVEEMQKLFEKTIKTLDEDSKRMREKNQELEDKITNIVMLLEKTRWSDNIYWIILSAAFFCGIFLICFNGPDRRVPVTVPAPSSIGKRVTKKVKKRRPSDQAMKIVRWSTEAPKERKRKRSKITVHNSNFWSELTRINNAIEILSSAEKKDQVASTDWVEEHRAVESVPLDESENSALEPLTPVGLNGRVIDLATDGVVSISSTGEKSRSAQSSPVPIDNRARRYSASRLDESPKKKRSFKSLLKNVFN